MVVAVRVLSKVAKVDCSVGVVVSVAMCLLEESSRNIAFSSCFEDDVGFV